MSDRNFYSFVSLTGYLFRLSEVIVYGPHINITSYEDGDVKLLKALTEPFTQYVIKVKSKPAYFQ